MKSVALLALDSLPDHNIWCVNCTEIFLTSINIDEKCGQIKHHLISINPISLALTKLEIEKKVIR